MGDEQLIGALRRALKPKRGGAPSDKQLAAVIALERGQTRALTALPEGGARNRARQLHSRAVDLGLFQSQMSTATMDVLPAAPSMTSCIDMLPSDMLVHWPWICQHAPRILHLTASEVDHHHRRMLTAHVEGCVCPSSIAVTYEPPAPKVVDEFRVHNNKIIDEQLKPYATGAKASGALYMPEKTHACVLVPPVACRFEMQRGGDRPRRLLRVFGHVATVDALGASGVVDSPAVGASDEERADWRYAHEAAIVHVLSRTACERTQQRAQRMARRATPAGNARVNHFVLVRKVPAHAMTGHRERAERGGVRRRRERVRRSRSRLARADRRSRDDQR